MNRQQSTSISGNHHPENRKIVVVAEEAERVRTILRRYLELGSLNLLMADLRERGIVTKVRSLKTGRTIGGIPFTRGPLAHLLRNRFYISEVAFKGEILAGEQPAIIDRDLFDAVQAKLNRQRNDHRTGRATSGAPLIGRLYDDRGNRMTPSHVRKGRIKYRYYLSSPLLQGQPERAGSVARVPAAEIEARVASAIREHFADRADSDDRDLIRARVVRIELQADQLVIELKTEEAPSSLRNAAASDRPVLRIPWKKTPMKRRREIIVPVSGSPHDLQPIRAETRATLVAAIARGRRWLDEIVAGTVTDAEQIAAREKCSIRQVNMTISLAFLAPELVKAAIQGRLPRGIGVTRLRDAPAEWSRQHAMLGLSSSLTILRGRRVSSHGRVFDVIVLGKPGRDPKGAPMATLEAALFESGRPVLIAPQVPRPQMGTNVLVAWNCSTEQARATAFAMPILKRASRVVVLTVEGGAAVPGPTGEQLCRYLQLNGVPAKPLTVGLDGRLTGEAVLAHANALGCDLLIKGAYTQSRLRQLIFGGTTRYILSNAQLPVLMAH